MGRTLAGLVVLWGPLKADLTDLMMVDCPAEVWQGTNGAIVRSGELKLHPERSR